MGKLPYIQFYTGDWIKDPNLSMCLPSTRGIWIDMLCAMHENGRTGQVKGTTEQLARICRCTEEEIKKSLRELLESKTADVRYSNGIGVRVGNEKTGESESECKLRKDI